MTRSIHTLWDDLVAAALLGTERRPPALTGSETGDGLGRVLAALSTPGSDPGSTLLAAAGTIAVYRRVGRTPDSDAAAMPSSCAADAIPACSRRAAGHLGRMLRGDHSDVLPEWLTALAASGRRVADECLVALLERGRTNRELRPLIAPVLGRRGAWLAARNPDWAFARGDALEPADWQTGTRADRLVVLRQLRRDDPDRGRALVESTWAEDPPEDRAAFLEAFTNGLGAADEPFLEAALDDRRREVRRTAADLLARLPESRLSVRVKARVGPSLKLTGGTKPAFDVVLPEACDKAMVRDGIEPKPTPAARNMGERAWWLYQMLGIVPPSTWCALFGSEPEALLAAASRSSEWHHVLWKGWALAAGRHRDSAWAEALLGLIPPELGLAQDLFQTLADAATLEGREAIVLDRLRIQGELLTNGHLALPLLRACRHPWSPTFARVVLDRIRQTIAADSSTSHWQLAQLMPQLGRAIPPALATEAAGAWPVESTSWAYWSNPVNAFLSLLQFRHEMLTELAS
jgi:hypothetical protein